MKYPDVKWVCIALGVLAPVLLGIQLGQDKLAASLSERARLLYPHSDGFTNISLRWSAANSPTYSLIVQAATEADVQATVNLHPLSGHDALLTSTRSFTPTESVSPSWPYLVATGRLR